MTTKPAQHTRHCIRIALLAFVVALVAACGGEDSAPPPPPPAVGSATIGAAGGTVDGPDGVQLVVPPDALSAPVTIRIARSAAGAPALPAEAGQAPVYEITPHDLAFAFPVQVRLPLTVAASADPVVMAAAPGGDWATVPAVIGNGYAAIERATLSYFSGGVCAISVGSTDPYPCSRTSIGVTDLTTTPPGGYEVIPWPGNVVVRAFTAPVTARYRVSYAAARDCSNAELTVRRIEMPLGGTLHSQTVLVRQPLTLTPAGNARAAIGSFDFEAPVTAAQNGTLTFGFDFSCTRAYRGRRHFATVHDLRLVRITPPPAVPSITQQPANAAVTAGASATFTVLASGAATLDYTWERSNDNGANWQPLGAGAAIAGGSGFTLTAALADHGAQFRAQVCSVAGIQRTCVTSNAALLTVTPASTPPAFTAHPADLVIVAGQTASFTAVASATPAPEVRWQVAAPGSSAFSDVSGEPGCASTPAPGTGSQTASTCTIAQTGVANSGRRYRALAINAAAPAGVPSNAATLTIHPAPVPPTITTHPAAQTAVQGGSATFTVVAIGTAPLSYRWRINGVEVTDGAFAIGACAGSAIIGGASLLLSGLSAGCNGATVFVVVSNGIAPDATSNPATLTVTPPDRPTILQAPQSQTVDVGQPATFSVQATGTNLTYQWLVTRRTTALGTGYGLYEEIAGATGDTYTLPAATLGDDGAVFAVRVCNGPAQAPTYPTCWFVGQIFNGTEARLTIREVVSQNFAVVASGTTQNLNDVAFANANQGVAVGDGGTLLYTFDGGQTWLPAPVQGATAATRDIRAVALAANGYGVAVGPGVLLFTRTFGTQWGQELAGDPADIGCCSDAAFAGTTALMSPFALNVRGFMRWDGATVLGFPAVGPLEVQRVEFATATAGAAIGSPGTMLQRTTNGGTDWSAATQPADIAVGTLAFASPTAAVAANTDGILLRSTDGGASWAALYGGGATRSTEGLAFNGAGVGLAVGNGPSFGLMRSADAGQTWIPLALPGLSGTLRAVAFAGPNVAVAVGDGGTVVRFTAGGL
jgi:photosystem II stability/assembly factor-like uncharacterized protein